MEPVQDAPPLQAAKNTGKVHVGHLELVEEGDQPNRKKRRNKAHMAMAAGVTLFIAGSAYIGVINSWREDEPSPTPSKPPVMPPSSSPSQPPSLPPLSPPPSMPPPSPPPSAPTPSPPPPSSPPSPPPPSSHRRCRHPCRRPRRLCGRSTPTRTAFPATARACHRPLLQTLHSPASRLSPPAMLAALPWRAVPRSPSPPPAR